MVLLIKRMQIYSLKNMKKIKEKIIAIIPARKGSKGLKNKNIKLLHGKKLYMWPVDAALKSGIFNKIIITTDIPQILSTSIPNVIIHNRPKRFCKDISPSSEFIFDVISQYVTDEEYFCLLEPTSPFTDAQDIKRSFKKLLRNKIANSLVSVMENEKYHPDFNFTNISDLIKPIKKNFNTTRRQDLKKVFCLDGSIYISSIKEFVRQKSFISKNTTSIILNRYKNIEIDDIYDFTYCEYIAKKLYEKKIL